jgi:ribosomal protein S18 acetylase RimI-like enzyme
MTISVHAGELKHLPDLVPLFDAYRQFYRQASDLEGARAYLLDRLSQGEATVFIAYLRGAAGPQAVGFTLLYDTFTSVAMKPLCILNDLYTIPEARGRGTGTALIARAREYAVAKGAFRLRLRTAHDNLTAQSVYEKLGFKRDEIYFTYDLNPESA